MDNDILMRVIAQDEYSRQLETAREMVGEMTDEEKKSIKAAYEMEKAEKAAAEGAKDQARANQENTVSFTELNQAVEFGQKVIESFKQAYEFAKEGAAIERIGEQWAATTRSFGVNGDKLIAKIDEVTGRTIDDEAAMAAATRSLTQGVVTSSEQVANLFEIARASAVRFGGDTVGAYEGLSIAIETGNARQLKAILGVVDFAAAEKKLADELGKTTDQLTEAEQVQSRYNAVAERGAQLVADVGDAVNDDLSKFERMERAVGDLGDASKTAFADLLVPSVENATVVIDALNGELGRDVVQEYTEHVADLTQQLADGTISEMRFRQELNRSSEIAEGATLTYNGLTGAIGGTELGTHDLIQAQIYLAGALRDSKGETSEAARMAARLSEAYKDTSESTQTLYTDEQLLKASVSELNAVIGGAVGKEMEDYKNKQEENRAKAAELQKELEKLQAAHGRVGKSQVKNEMSAAELNLATINLAESQARLADETDPQKQAELAVKVENLTGKIAGANATTTTWVDNSKRISEITGTLDELNGAYDANAAVHEEATARIISGFLLQRAMIDGELAPAEIAALTAINKELGIYDQATATALTNANAAWDTFVKTGNVELVTNQVRILHGEMAGLPTFKEILINLAITGYEDLKNVRDELGASPEDIYGKSSSATKPTSGKRKGGGEAGDGFQHGGSFIVPPGYNENFPIRVSSGEHVQVTPAGQSVTNNSPTFNIPITVNAAPGMDTASLARQVGIVLGRQLRQYKTAGMSTMRGS